MCVFTGTFAEPSQLNQKLDMQVMGRFLFSQHENTRNVVILGFLIQELWNMRENVESVLANLLSTDLLKIKDASFSIYIYMYI